MEQNKFVWDSKMKHRVELMIILLVITVIGNLVVYYLNHRYETSNINSIAQSKEVVKQLTQAPQVISDTPTASPTAKLTNCTLFQTGVYSLCLPKSWVAAKTSASGTRFEPKSIKTDPSIDYLTITVVTTPISPLPTPVKTYTKYQSVEVGSSTGYRTDYIPQKNKDGFVIPLASGCQDPYEIIVPAKKTALLIKSCKQYETVSQSLLETFTLK